MDKDLVSIIMPAHNAERYIHEAIKSVIKQTYKSWELLIVDDCSTDKTWEIIKDYQKNKKIKNFKQKEKLGPGLARNIAIEKAQGKYIAFLDADDIWEAEKLNLQINFIKKNHLFFTYSSYLIINNDGLVTKQYTAPPSITYQSMLKSNRVGNLTGIYDVGYFNKKYFDKKFKHEDYVMYLDLIKQVGSTQGINQSLAYHRVYKNSISSKKYQTIFWQWKIYRKKEKLNLLFSLYYLGFYIFYGLSKYKNYKE